MVTSSLSSMLTTQGPTRTLARASKSSFSSTIHTGTRCRRSTVVSSLSSTASTHASLVVPSTSLTVRLASQAWPSPSTYSQTESQVRRLASSSVTLVTLLTSSLLTTSVSHVTRHVQHAGLVARRMTDSSVPPVPRSSPFSGPTWRSVSRWSRAVLMAVTSIPSRDVRAARWDVFHALHRSHARSVTPSLSDHYLSLVAV